MKARFFAHHERAREIIATLLPYARQLEPMLQLEGITVTVEKYVRRRSLEANARYWSIVDALARHVGYTKNELHEALLCEWSGYEVVSFQDYDIRRPNKRSSKLSVEDFGELMGIAERWCVESGVVWQEDAA
jgi:hypothetical protein